MIGARYKIAEDARRPPRSTVPNIGFKSPAPLTEITLPNRGITPTFEGSKAERRRYPYQLPSRWLCAFACLKPWPAQTEIFGTFVIITADKER